MADATGATLIATGMLPFVVLAAAALTAPVALALLALYRRAVLRSMAERGAARADGQPDTPPPAPPPPPAGLEFSPAAATDAPTDAQSRAAASLRRAVGVQIAGGLAYASAFAAAWMAVLADSGLPPVRFLWLLACHAWPAVLAVGIIAAASRRQRLLLAGAYLALLSVVALVALARNPDFTAGQAAGFWLLVNAPPTLLLFAFLRRRVRAVGPLVLAFMVTAVAGSQVAVSLIGESEAAMRAAVGAGLLFGLDGTGTFFAIMLAGTVLAAAAGWKWLQWLGRLHRERRTGDQTLTLDAMWLLFGVVQSIGFAFEGILWVFTGLVAFAACKLATLGGHRCAGLGRARGRAPSLLLLRVFALGARSERLFDALTARWLRAGDISLIAGPDLATTTVEPHEFLDFVGGRLSRQFVRDDADLARRLQARALGPDPDGRHRVNEFFCHADTWQAAMRRLAATADAVLMDLRSFSPANQGCRYELQQLLDTVPLARVVFLIDATTDRAFLEASVRRLWQTVAADSPNRRPPTVRLRLLAADARGEPDVEPLLGLLHAAAAGRAT
ncbi:hypothetical protein [Thauera sinica]|uniref:Uncharacterized protein n=1 Tax=Thauera sinica TaxID=2665146 RepID=A0ABW1ATP6_9RHOO|nr:hypothetical protein [Thauera sp. K11]ATE61915.1 hypothetical protein CCZ27_19825 [Thauera sp. K11]